MGGAIFTLWPLGFHFENFTLLSSVWELRKLREREIRHWFLFWFLISVKITYVSLTVVFWMFNFVECLYSLIYSKLGFLTDFFKFCIIFRVFLFLQFLRKKIGFWKCWNVLKLVFITMLFLDSWFCVGLIDKIGQRKDNIIYIWLLNAVRFLAEYGKEWTWFFFLVVGFLGLMIFIWILVSNSSVWLPGKWNKRK